MEGGGGRRGETGFAGPLSIRHRMGLIYRALCSLARVCVCVFVCERLEASRIEVFARDPSYQSMHARACV